MSWFEHFALFIIALLANIFSAFSGGGAGLVQLPALILLGLSFSIALATHKIASVALGVGATLRHIKEKPLERLFAFLILVTGIPGTIVGANIIVLIPDRTAQTALGILTLCLGAYSWLNPQLGQHQQTLHRNTLGYLIGGSVLFVIGILNGSLTSGTGLFVTLWLVRWFGLDYKRAIAYTLIIVGIFWNASGAITLGLLSEIKWSWLPALLLGSFLGGYIGAHLAILKGNRWIKRGFELVTILIGTKLIVG